MSSVRTRAVVLGLLAVSALGAPDARAERQAYSRYQSIVDRQMFGPLPAGFDPAKMPGEVSKSSQKELTKEQEQLKSAIRFSVINVTPDGAVAVGFTDSSDGKNPRHYYLKVGESRGGWLVKAADPETATMTVSKGEIEVTLTIGGDSAKDAAATAKTGAAKAEAAPAAANAPGGLSRLPGTLGRRRLKRDADAKAEAEEIRRQREEDRKAREAEREEMRSQLNDLKDILAARREEEAKAGEAKKAAPEGEAGGAHENDDAE